MKKIFYSTILFIWATYSFGQAPFQMHYENTLGLDGDHYSIERARPGSKSDFAYACAGSYFDGNKEIFHVFTTDEAGVIIWETILNEFEGRILDIAVEKHANHNYGRVAVTGFTGQIGSEELYIGLFSGKDGQLITDRTIPSQSIERKTAGTSIFFHEASNMIIVGGIDYKGNIDSPTGQAIYLSVEGSLLSVNWIKHLVNCNGSTMSSINDITAVEKQVFLTGTVYTPLPSILGAKQVLGFLIDPQDGSLIQNLSHIPTTGKGHRAMGTSAHYNNKTKTFHWMYNVSIPNINYPDENRPYILNFKYNEVAQQPLSLVNGIKLEGQLGDGAIPGFKSNPNVTGLSLTLSNEQKDHYVLSGIVESYGTLGDTVISFFQHLDINTGATLDFAQLWGNSKITDSFPIQGSFYSFINHDWLNADVYTPKSTTLSLKGDAFVSIVPSKSVSPGNSYSHDLVSASLNPGVTNSNCLTSFKLKFLPHTPIERICIDVEDDIYFPIHFDAHYHNAHSSWTNECQISGKSLYSLMSTKHNEGALNIFPNPANEILNIDMAEGEYSVVITGISGQKAAEVQLSNVGSTNQIDISNLKPGVYFIKVIAKDETIRIKKFVKE